MLPKLLVYTRGTIPLYRLAIFKCINEKATGLNGVKFKTMVYAHEKGKLWWSWSDKEIKDLGRRIWKITSTKEGLKKHSQRMRDFSEKAIKTSKKVIKTDLSKLTNEELVNLHKQLYEDCKEAHALMDTDIDAVDVVPVELLKNLIREQLSEFNERDFNEIYTKLVTLIYTSYVSEEEKDLLKLLVRIKKEKINFAELKDSDLYSELQKIIGKFWWTCLGWENTEVKTEDDYIEDLKNYNQIIKEPLKRIQEIENYNRDIKTQREEPIKKYNLNKEIQHRLEVFDEYAFLHDLRKEMQNHTIHGFDLILKEIAKRIKAPVKQLEFYLFDEIYDLALGKKRFDGDEAKERERAEFLIADEKGIRLFIGAEAEEKIKEVYKKDVRETKEVIGVCSSPGKAKGIVKVCKGIEEALEKMNKGDILVTGMTTPDYVLVMRKAAAIIADEGGITCHAAIVSRELGIPCITSTKIATKVLKDGDLVEVDADNGIIKKINKND